MSLKKIEKTLIGFQNIWQNSAENHPAIVCFQTLVGVYHRKIGGEPKAIVLLGTIVKWNIIAK